MNQVLENYQHWTYNFLVFHTMFNHLSFSLSHTHSLVFHNYHNDYFEHFKIQTHSSHIDSILDAHLTRTYVDARRLGWRRQTRLINSFPLSSPGEAPDQSERAPVPAAAAVKTPQPPVCYGALH